MKLDLVTAYAASFARVASWAIVAGVVYRCGGASQLAVLALARATVGLFSYASLGIVPVLVGRLNNPLAVVPVYGDPSQLDYAPRQSAAGDRESPSRIYLNAWWVVVLACAVAFAVGVLYVANAHWIHHGIAANSIDFAPVALPILIGVLLRTVGDVPGALLQARNRLARDNLSLLAGEVVFALGAILVALDKFNRQEARIAAMAFLVASAFTTLCRCGSTRGLLPNQGLSYDFRIMAMLLASGAWVVLGQLADWLYAPFNQILIDRYVSITAVANYVPAIQIDGAMLLIVSGLSVVLLPKTAIAHASNDLQTIRTYYVRGTLFSLLALVACAFAVVAFDEMIFKLWFADPMPATQAILPLVLIHTVIGGTASIGRSVLFGIGRIKAYAISAVAGGLANVALALLLVTQTNLGLRGIVLATVITVTLRCAIWMPWYTLRALREPAMAQPASSGGI